MALLAVFSLGLLSGQLVVVSFTEAGSLLAQQDDTVVYACVLGKVVPRLGVQRNLSVSVLPVDEVLFHLPLSVST